MIKEHKIAGIDKNICTCEKKIAYNYIFSYADLLKRSKDFDYIIKIIQEDIERKETMKKYNIILILEYIKNNIQKYIDHFFIAWNYSDIGNFITL